MTVSRVEGSMRDPRVDPRKGDELRGGKSHRYVGRIYENGEIGFTYWPNSSSGNGTGNDCVTSIETWRKWAADAEVIHRAE